MSRLFSDALVLWRWKVARSGVEVVGDPFPFRMVAGVVRPGEITIDPESDEESVVVMPIKEEFGPVNGWGITMEGELMWCEEVRTSPMLPGETLRVTFKSRKVWVGER